MKKFALELKEVGEKSTKRDLSYSLLALGVWAVADKESNLVFSTNADVASIFSNFGFSAFGLFNAGGKAANEPSTRGGGINGYSYSMSSNNKLINIVFPLSQCTQSSQAGSIISTFIGSSPTAAGGTLLIEAAEATLMGYTDFINQPYTGIINVQVKGGSIKNSMDLTWNDDSYYSEFDYQLQYCSDSVLSRGAGTCVLQYYAEFVASTSGSVITIEDNPSGGVMDEMIIAGNQNLYNVHFFGGTHGNRSTTLTITSTSTDDVQDNLILADKNYNILALVTSCDISSGVGSCILSTPLNLPDNTELYGSTVQLIDCEVYSVFTASTVNFVASVDSNSPTVIAIESQVAGTISDGLLFNKEGTTYYLRNCDPNVLAGNSGTCQLKDSNGLSITMTGGMYSRLIATFSSTLIITSVLDGKVVNGMKIKVAGVAGLVKLTGCSLTTDQATGITSGVCTMQSAHSIPEGSYFEPYGLGTCNLQTPDGTPFVPANALSSSGLNGWVTATNVEIPLDMEMYGIGKTSSLIYGKPITDGSTIMNADIPGGTVLSGCMHFATAASQSLSTCDKFWNVYVSENSKELTQAMYNDPTQGLDTYNHRTQTHPENIPTIGMMVECVTSGCGIQAKTYLVSIDSVNGIFTLSQPLKGVRLGASGSQSEGQVDVKFSGITDSSFIAAHPTLGIKVAGTFSTSHPQVLPHAVMQGVSQCTTTKKGLSGYFDPTYFDPYVQYQYKNRDAHYTISISLDIQTIFTAVAVNFGITPISTLVSVNVSNPQAFEGTDYGSFYVNSGYVPMAPLYCLHESDDDAAACMISTNNHLYYPIVTTMDLHSGIQCFCSAPTKSADPKTYCDVLPLIQIALIYFPDDVDPETGLSKADRSGDKNTIAFARAMKAKFEAAGGGVFKNGDGDLAISSFIFPAIQSAYLSHFKDGAYTNFENVCEAAGPGLKNCVMMLSTFEVTPDQFLSCNDVGLQMTAFQSEERLYQIANDTYGLEYYSLSCTNMIYQEQAMRLITTQPPISLVQPYGKCHSTLRTAVPAALGAAAGSANLYTGLLVTFFLYLAVTSINTINARRGKEPILPPMQKTRKKWMITDHHITILQSTIEKLINKLPISDEEKIQLSNDFHNDYMFLMEDEEKIPLAEATEKKYHIIDVESANDIKMA